MSQTPLPPGEFQTAYDHPPAAKVPRRGMPWWAWVLVGGGVIFGLLFVALIIFGLNMTELVVIPGRQLPGEHRQTIDDLGLIQSDEQIQYFYSDGFFDIKDGMYFFTDRQVVLYAEEWDPPAIMIPYDQIANISAQFSDQWIEDSMIHIQLTDGSEVWFPVTTDEGGDRRFYDALRATWQRLR